MFLLRRNKMKMPKLTKMAMALAAASVIALPGMAQAIVIDGIDVGNGVLTFVSSTMMEQRVGGGIVTGDGQVVQGVGNVTEIRSDGVLVWAPSLTNNELTFTFNNYVSQNYTPTAVGFTGGTVNFYHDILTTDGTGANYATGTGFGDGTLWMSLAGVTFNDPLHPASCTGVTLCATGVLTGTVDLNGSGLLGVTGAGLANSYFDTNGTIAAGTGNLADWQLGSNTNNQHPSGFIMGTHGTASLSNVRTVPEPATLGLLGLGLLGLGLARRGRKQA
jgi:PEP-CTERM motif